MSKLIKRNDRVVVIAGNHKGKAGVVLSKNEDRVVIQGINLRKKHIKRTQKTQAAQILEMEMPIHISNVAFCNSKDKPVKVKVKVEKDGKKLVYMDEGKEVVLRTK
jgi:large subunit ribosomal protein L24